MKIQLVAYIHICLVKHHDIYYFSVKINIVTIQMGPLLNTQRQCLCYGPPVTLLEPVSLFETGQPNLKLYLQLTNLKWIKRS